MIDKRCLTDEWISQKSRELHYTDKKRIERAIYAFSILDMLASNRCEFVLRGGLSLMLRFQEGLNRISTDVDIVCSPDTKIDDFLVNYSDYGFTSYEHFGTTEVWNIVPVNHIKFCYKSIYDTEDSALGYTVLDVLFDEQRYPHIQEINLESGLIITIGDNHLIKAPSIEDTLGNELSAYIDRYNMPRKMFKQLYDVAYLIDKVDYVEDVKASFINTVKIKRNCCNLSEVDFDELYDVMRLLSYNISVGETMDYLSPAIIQNALIFSALYMFKSEYTIDEAIVNLSKVAYLVTCMQYNAPHIEHYDGNLASISGIVIGEVLPQKLNLLKDTNPEAFYYWCKVEEIYKYV